jgi:23S rRNA (adenine2030-N6)-methyltransferase
MPYLWSLRIGAAGESLEGRIEMLSYQHSYHAGGAADVHKHAALCLLLAHLNAKPKPYSVIDLYAGEGTYALDTAEAQKTAEYRDGIGKLWNRDARGIGPLLEAVRAENPTGTLTFYPGSPAIARQAMRDDDRLVLNELHPGAFASLKRWARRDARITVHRRDGLEALLALVPPQPRRGLVLIDPSYEIKADYGAVPAKLGRALHKWREGIFMVWYPLISDGRHRPLVEGLKVLGAPCFASELHFERKARRAIAAKERADVGLKGTGIAVINPPWQFDREMTKVSEALAGALDAKSVVRDATSA